MMKKILLSLFLVLVILGTSAFAVGPLPSPPVSVSEEDGVPIVFPSKIKFTNGTVTDNGDGTVSVTVGAAVPGDITDVWSTASGNVNALVAASGDSLDASLADSTIPWKAGLASAIPATCTEPMAYWSTDTNTLSICTAADTWQSLSVILSLTDYVTKALFDAQTILAATADNTPAALTIAEQKIVGRVTGGNVAALDIDSDLSSVSASDDTVPSAKATKTYADLKAPIASPTFTGVATFPNDGLHVLDTNASHDLIITPGSDLSADRILTIITGDAARTLTIGASATINANTTALSSPGNWKLFYTDGSGVQTEVALDATGTVLTSNGVAAAPTFQTPSGSGDITGVWTDDTGDVSALTAGAGDSFNANAADSSAPFVEGLAAALPGTCTEGQTYRATNTDALYICTAANTWSEYLNSNISAIAGLTFADVSIISLTGVGAVETLTSGGELRYLRSSAGNLALEFDALDLDDVADSATYQKVAATDVDAASHVNLVQDSDGTGAVQFTGLSATRAITLDDAAQTLAARNRENTFTENNVFGNADTDTLAIQSLLKGVGKSIQITDTVASPTYATGVYELFVRDDIEAGGTMYAASFQSKLTSGNTGFINLGEDPDNGTNYWGLAAPSTLGQNLTWVHPNAVPSANDLITFGAVSLDKTTITYTTLSELMDAVLGSTQGSIIYRGAATWSMLGPGTVGYALLTGGAAANPAWGAVSASASGADGLVQIATTGALDSDAAFKFDKATNTLNITQNGTDPALTLGDGTYTMGHTPLLYCEGVSEFDGAGYFDSTLAVGSTLGVTGVSTFTGAVLLTGGVTSLGAAADLSGATVTFGTIAGTIDAGGATSLEIPNGANPTTDAAGEVAVDTSAGSGGGLRIYTNATPGAVTIPIYIMGSPIIVKDPVAASDYPAFFTPYAITLRSVHYLCVGGTSWTGQLQICDANGASCGNTETADVTAVAGTTTNSTTFSDATVPANVWVAVKTTSVSGSPTSITIQPDFTVDQVN